MIFAAGKGTRLKPLTDTMPKALVKVGGQTLLEHVLDKLEDGGFNRIVVNVHHFGEQIISFLASRHEDIKISDERDELLDTGGGLRKAAPLFSPYQPILLHNVDILSNANLTALYDVIANSQQAGPSAVLLVSWRKTQRYLVFNDDMRLVGWVNIATGETKSPFPQVKAALSAQTFPIAATDEPMTIPVSSGNAGKSSLHLFAFSGIHVFHPSLFPLMDSWPRKFPIMDFYLKTCDRAAIRGVTQPCLRLIDVGKLDTLRQAEERAANLESADVRDNGI